MNKPDRPSVRVAVKYGLLQLPGQMAFFLVLILLRRWLEIPVYLMWALIGCWVGKDVILFFVLWRFYDPDQHTDRFGMVGRKGIALTRIDPDGYVRVRSERWQADAARKSVTIEKGEKVCVVGVDGLKLTVTKCASDPQK